MKLICWRNNRLRRSAKTAHTSNGLGGQISKQNFHNHPHQNKRHQTDPKNLTLREPSKQKTQSKTRPKRLNPTNRTTVKIAQEL
jgi:hypothetical protein